MNGRDLLNLLPDTVKQQIIAKYGSLDNYYQHVFNIHEADYAIYIAKPADSRQRRSEIKHQIFDLEEELEAFGLDDGSAVIVEISSDHGDQIVGNLVRRLRG